MLEFDIIQITMFHVEFNIKFFTIESFTMFFRDHKCYSIKRLEIKQKHSSLIIMFILIVYNYMSRL